MARYQVEQEVPWSEVLRALRWRVYMRMEGVEAILSSQAGVWEKESLCAAERHLRRSLHTYRALRAFLGYKGKTKMERRALELLDRGT